MLQLYNINFGPKHSRTLSMAIKLNNSTGGLVDERNLTVDVSEIVRDFGHQ